MIKGRHMLSLGRRHQTNHIHRHTMHIMVLASSNTQKRRNLPAWRCSFEHSVSLRPSFPGLPAAEQTDLVNPTLQNGYVVCASVGSVSVAVVFRLVLERPPAKEKFKQETLRGRNGCVTSTVGSSTRSTCSSVLSSFSCLLIPFYTLPLHTTSTYCGHDQHTRTNQPIAMHNKGSSLFGPRRLSLLSACFKWGVRQGLAYVVLKEEEEAKNHKSLHRCLFQKWEEEQIYNNVYQCEWRERWGHQHIFGHVDNLPPLHSQLTRPSDFSTHVVSFSFFPFRGSLNYFSLFFFTISSIFSSSCFSLSLRPCADSCTPSTHLLPRSLPSLPPSRAFYKHPTLSVHIHPFSYSSSLDSRIHVPLSSFLHVLDRFKCGWAGRAAHALFGSSRYIEKRGGEGEED